MPRSLGRHELAELDVRPRVPRDLLSDAGRRVLAPCGGRPRVGELGGHPSGRHLRIPRPHATTGDAKSTFSGGHLGPGRQMSGTGASRDNAKECHTKQEGLAWQGAKLGAEQSHPHGPEPSFLTDVEHGVVSASRVASL